LNLLKNLIKRLKKPICYENVLNLHYFPLPASQESSKKGDATDFAQFCEKSAV